MRIHLIAVAMAAAVATPALAEDHPSPGELNRADIRCVLAMVQMAKNETYKQWGQFGIFYYTGRLYGRNADFDLAEGLKREYRGMPPADYNGEVKRCSDALGKTSQALEDLKPAVSRRGVGG